MTEPEVMPFLRGRIKEKGCIIHPLADDSKEMAEARKLCGPEIFRMAFNANMEYLVATFATFTPEAHIQCVYDSVISNPYFNKLARENFTTTPNLVHMLPSFFQTSNLQNNE